MSKPRVIPGNDLTAEVLNGKKISGCGSNITLLSAGGGTMRLQGKVAIVTGGALGIGEAYSLGMAKEGASVVVADLDDKAGVRAGMNASGGKALFGKTDISREAEAER